MTLYVKAGPDGKSLGDCPFAHYVRMVLHAKNLDYDLRPCTAATKPQWLIEYYDGKMPALRHRRECYVESDTIAAYLDFFFPEPAFAPVVDAATEAVQGFFSSVAQYIKHTPDGDASEESKREKLRASLQKLETYLLSTTNGPYLHGPTLSLLDCKLAPQLYVLVTAMKAFKTTSSIDLESDYPRVHAYAKHMLEKDPSCTATTCSPEVVEWGWTQARGA